MPHKCYITTCGFPLVLNLVSSTSFGLTNLRLGFFKKFHLQWFSVTRQSCLLCTAHVPIRRVSHPLLAWSPWKIWFILNFFLEYWVFSSKPPPRPPLLEAICEGLLNNSTVQSCCQYPQLSTVQSEPHSATGFTTPSPAPPGTQKTHRPFLPP